MILCVIFLGLFGMVLGKTLVSERTALSVISQVENYLQIIAILLICELNIRHLNRKSGEIGLNVFFGCICLNALLICASIYLFSPSVLDPFHGGVITERADAYANGMSPAALSAQAGRHARVIRPSLHRRHIACSGTDDAGRLVTHARSHPECRIFWLHHAWRHFKRIQGVRGLDGAGSSPVPLFEPGQFKAGTPVNDRGCDSRCRHGQDRGSALVLQTSI